ncbi:MAG: hypothetical protein H7X95_00350, partial [Deltaproteobacteria bacterium]|nr:hypothetical protein [Deltaproteobacteria bacterium]
MVPAWAAQALAADAKPTLTLRTAPAEARPGEYVVLEVGATIPAGYHMYALTKIAAGPKPLAITVDDTRLSPAGGWFSAVAPTVAFDARFGKAVEQFAGAVLHRRVFLVPSGTAAGSRAVSVAVAGQICDERQCVVFRENLSAALRI